VFQIQEKTSGESLFLRKLVLGIPAQASGKNLTRPPMPSAPRFVLVTSSNYNKGMEKIAINPSRLEWCLNAVQIDINQLSTELKIAQKTLDQAYGYRGLKIFTSLKLRFQDFQRRLRLK
jgi:hypothetical protein